MPHLLHLLPAALASLSYCFAQHVAPTTPVPLGIQTYVSRPDIQAPRWLIQVFDKDRLAPGYWFVSPYEINGYRKPGGSWIGPHIYDGDGELVWSGSHMFHNINVMDFKIINVNGEEVLSMLYAMEGNAYILDKQYRVRETIFVGEPGLTFNMHDFHTVEDGTKYLFLQRNITYASREMSLEQLGFDGECFVAFPGFEERDAVTQELLFKWDATGKIPLSDSTMDFAPVEQRCLGDWDFLHSNAVDKFPDGNYLLSTRHSDTLYKISKDDGSIIWRLHGLGGPRGDFEMGNLNFSRQHHARFREQNATHTIITLFDNAMGADPQPATSGWSRALKIALREDTQPMTAEIIASYDHPSHHRAFRRGDYQILPNGNAFIGWSERALQSEHAEDGTLLMQAALETKILGTYRAFKFPLVAAPDYPPDIYSAASTAADGTCVTTVHVSWNGATEVARWRLFKSDVAGAIFVELADEPRSGFETALTYAGYAKYVHVQAFDRHGKQLAFGRSKIFDTVSEGELDIVAVAAEQAWLLNPVVEKVWWLRHSWFAIFVCGAVSGCVFILAVAWAMRRGILGTRWVAKFRSRGGPAYRAIALHDIGEFDEAGLDDVEAKRRLRPSLDDEVRFQLHDDEDEDADAKSGTPSTDRSLGK